MSFAKAVMYDITLNAAYPGRIRYVELGNEVNWEDNWPSVAADYPLYADLVVEIRNHLDSLPALIGLDPADIPLLTVGFGNIQRSTSKHMDVLQAIHNLGLGSGLVDAVDFHSHEKWWKYTDIEASTISIRADLNSFVGTFPGVELLIMETSTWSGEVFENDQVTSQGFQSFKEQAAFSVMSYITALANDIKQIRGGVLEDRETRACVAPCDPTTPHKFTKLYK